MKFNVGDIVKYRSEGKDIIGKIIKLESSDETMVVIDDISRRKWKNSRIEIDKLYRIPKKELEDLNIHIKKRRNSKLTVEALNELIKERFNKILENSHDKRIEWMDKSDFGSLADYLIGECEYRWWIGNEKKFQQDLDDMNDYDGTDNAKISQEIDEIINLILNSEMVENSLNSGLSNQQKFQHEIAKKNEERKSLEQAIKEKRKELETLSNGNIKKKDKVIPGVDSRFINTGDEGKENIPTVKEFIDKYLLENKIKIENVKNKSKLEKEMKLAYNKLYPNHTRRLSSFHKELPRKS